MDMIKLKSLLTEVEVLDDGSLKISNIDDISTQQWEKISQFMRQRNYDSRGAADAKRAVTKFLKNPNNQAPDVINYDIHPVWVDIIKIVLNLKDTNPKKAEKLSYSPAKIIRDAKRYFGITNDLNQAGYILPDGSLLDFSGGGGRTRGLDHTEIAYIFHKNNVEIPSEAGSATPYMEGFMQTCKAIRIGGSQNFVDVRHMPTRQQANQLLKLFSMYNGKITLDIKDRKYGRDFRSYTEGTKPSRILRDIITYFKTGTISHQPLTQNPDLKEAEEQNENGIDTDRLMYNDDYLDDVAEKMGYDDDFTKQFWNQRFLPTLYHCTTEENYEGIKVNGLEMKSDRRGAVSNRHIGPAVFTTQEKEEISFFKHYYGPVVIAINTKQMNADGFTPDVEREPDWDRALKLSFVLQKSGYPEDRAEAGRFVDSSDQNTQGTVIIYSHIPPIYLSLVEYD